MSDNTSDTPTGIDDGLGEPSMEDILASIRRIIAEDDGTDNGHVDLSSGLSLAPEAIMGGAQLAETPMDLDDVLVLDDAIVDDILIDAADTSDFSDIDLSDAASEAEFNPVSNVVSDLEDKLSLKSDGASTNLGKVDSLDSVDLVLPEPDHEADRLLEEALGIPDSFELEIEEIDIDEMDDNVFSTSKSSLEGSESKFAEDSDLDLVKSLMADLTDTSFMDESDMTATSENVANDVMSAESLTETLAEAESITTPETAPEMEFVDDLVLDEGLELNVSDDDEADIEALLADIEDMEMAEQTPVRAENAISDDDLAMLDSLLGDAPDDAEEQDQILNDILDMAIHSEEAHNALELTVDDDLAINNLDDEVSEPNSLLELAAQAEADAEAELTDEMQFAMDPEPDTETTEEILNELDLVLSEVVDVETSATVEEAEIDELIEEISEQPAEMADEEAETVDLFIEEQENDDMAKTARKDAILDEVTETAAAGAFASLSQAVEENAVFTESGPRIGELVQDALRPMLKEWLDENLKTIVERAVTKEVKRIASGK